VGPLFEEGSVRAPPERARTGGKAGSDRAEDKDQAAGPSPPRPRKAVGWPLALGMCGVLGLIVGAALYFRAKPPAVVVAPPSKPTNEPATRPAINETAGRATTTNQTNMGTSSPPHPPVRGDLIADEYARSGNSIADDHTRPDDRTKTPKLSNPSFPQAGQLFY